jgi:hypothetical protein
MPGVPMPMPMPAAAPPMDGSNCFSMNLPTGMQGGAPQACRGLDPIGPQGPSINTMPPQHHDPMVAQQQ